MGAAELADHSCGNEGNRAHRTAFPIHSRMLRRGCSYVLAKMDALQYLSHRSIQNTGGVLTDGQKRTAELPGVLKVRRTGVTTGSSRPNAGLPAVVAELNPSFKSLDLPTARSASFNRWLNSKTNLRTFPKRVSICEFLGHARLRLIRSRQ
jgi:hypothetical protein